MKLLYLILALALCLSYGNAGCIVETISTIRTQEPNSLNNDNKISTTTIIPLSFKITWTTVPLSTQQQGFAG